jgi:prepilin-type N-terminal cleavage/methylation domain-containing protein
MRNQKQGFTLIELMIVIAIIAIIAAIAIPGLLSSQRASNERNASASLKTLASAEADFRGNDRDGNKIQDFWTIDVSGLYGVIPVGSAEMIKLIEVSVAGSDFVSAGTATLPATAGDIDEVASSAYAVPAPKAGFWYEAMLSDESVPSNPYATTTGGILNVTGSANTNSWYNHSKFGFLAFPDSFSAGRNAFFINEGNTIFKRPLNGPVKATSDLPGTAITLTVGTSGLVGTQVAETWPIDSILRVQYSKLD